MVFKNGNIGYWKGKKFNEEHRSKLKEGQRKSFLSGNRHVVRMKGSRNPMYGKTHSLEARQKIRMARIGKHPSQETIKKMIKNRKNTKPALGKHWKLSEYTKEKMSKSLMGNKRNLGKSFSEEHKRKIGDVHRGIKLSVETIKKIKESRANQIIPVKDTSIEVKVQNFLRELNIEYFTHQYMNIEHAYQCDILVPSMNLVIECDGDYWHNYPFGNEIDHIRTSELIQKGFKVLRLWERDIIKMDSITFKEKLNIIELGKL